MAMPCCVPLPRVRLCHRARIHRYLCIIKAGDPLALADDLMELFRPTIDLHVHQLLDAGVTTVPEARNDLVGALSAAFVTQKGVSPLSQVLVRLAQSVACSFETGKEDLAFPRELLPTDMSQDE